MRKYTSFFRNKVCSICKAPAKIYRVIGSEKVLLCGKEECSHKCDANFGFLNMCMAGQFEEN